MLITCHNCETVFQIDKTKIDPNGQQVRCSVCAHVWTVFADNEHERSRIRIGSLGDGSEGGVACSHAAGVGRA